MSRENVELVRESYDAIDRSDVDAATALYAADIEWRTGSGVPFEGTYRGIDEVRGLLQDWIGTFDVYSTEIYQLIDAGDLIVSSIRMRGRGAASGVEVDMELAQVITVRDRKLARVADYYTLTDALEAAGLAE